MYKTSFIFIAKKCQSLWKKNRMQTIIFFTLYHVSCIKCTCILIKKNQETLFIVSGEQIWTKRRNERQRFFLLYNNNTTPRSSTKSYNKNRSRLISACLLFSCNFTHDNIEDTDFTGELIPTILKEFKSCPCHLTSNISCIYSLGFFASFLFMLG